MVYARIKSQDGTEHPVWMTEDEVFGWFKEHNKDGTVTDSITLFAKAPLTVRKDQEGKPVPWMLTDMALDRQGERVDPSGADVKNFRKNPVILWAHEHERPAIGRLEGLALRDGQLRGKVNLDPVEVDAFAGMIRAKVERKTIAAGSIGFMPKKIEFVEDKKDPTRLVHKEWELLEFSLVNVPAHPGALAENAAPEGREADKLDIVLARLDAIESKIGNVVETKAEPNPFDAWLSKSPAAQAESAQDDTLVFVTPEKKTEGNNA